MRLLNTSTIQPHDFPGKEVPDYAILSHTWGQGEVTHHEGKERAGYAKIIKCCALAARDGWEYVWIDTLLHVGMSPVLTIPYKSGCKCRRVLSLACQSTKLA